MMRRVLFEPNELYSVSDRLDFIEIDSVSVVSAYSVSDRLGNMSPRSSPRGERRPDTREQRKSSLSIIALID